MHPLLAFAAAAAAALVLWKRARRKPVGGSPPSKLDVTLVLKGTPAKPEVDVCPEQVIAGRWEQVRWTVRDPQNTGAEVHLTRFRLKGSGDERDPMWGGRKGRKTIGAWVKPYARPGMYEYEVWLNGVPAADPDVLIKEG